MLSLTLHSLVIPQLQVVVLIAQIHDLAIGNTILSATVLQMTVQRALHNSQAFWLIFVYVFFSSFREETAKNSIQLIARDVSKLSLFATLYVPPVKLNVQPSFCTLGGVLVLVFASQIRKVFFVENLSSAVLSLKRTREIIKFCKSALLNSTTATRDTATRRPVDRAEAML